MLRHIMSVGLAMTVCTALIPTKVYAATLSIGSGLGGLIRSQIQAKPGDIIDLTFYLQAEPGNQFVKVQGWEGNPFFDTSELEQVTPLQWKIPLDFSLDLKASRNIATWKLKAKTSIVKDTIPDISAVIKYEELTAFGFESGKSPASGPDVVPQEPVPEPLTMLGAAAALGYGAILKRKYSKNTEF
jgi:hypothetical protein